VRTGEFKEGVFQPNIYDVVFMSHVLEHCFEPKRILAEIYRLLKKNGIVAIEVPNIEAYDLRFHGEKWKGWDLPYHLYLFSKKTLMQYLESLDFQIVFITTIGSHVLMRKGKKNPFYKIAYYLNTFFKVVEGRNLFMIARK
jgi:predicted SAM-dependent methyltransferase